MTFADEIFRQARDQVRVLYCIIDSMCDKDDALSPRQKLLNSAAASTLQTLGLLLDAEKLDAEEDSPQ